MYVICNNCLLSEKDAKPAMVCSTNELSVWKDFPKGLRVLLLDEDSNAAAELKLKLEAMDYIVSTFYNETEALSAFSGKPEDFHVAIVEVSTNNIAGSFKFLETAKDLPTIMTSNIHCLSTMMKGIALGAVEFLQKPLSEDKLRNIWQHVVHKAFSAGGSALSDSLKPVKQYSLPMLHLKLENGESKNDIEKSENVTPPQQSDNEQSEASDRYPAPLTPQLQQGGRLLDEVDCQDNIDSSTEKETEKQDEELKFVETTCDTSIAEGTLQEDKPQEPRKTVVKQEHESPNGNKTMCSLPRPFEKQNLKDSNCGIESPSKASGLQNSRGNKAKQKKMKVDWTPELHKKFVHAVEQLGVDQAIPSRVLELMQVEGLTRHNVASHLQKYRMHKRHILPKEGDRRWPHSTDQMPRNYYFHKPIMAFPPYHSNHLVPTGSVYPTWGAPSNQPTAVQMWGLPGYTPWQQADSWNWKPYPEMHADAWGCPMMPPPHGPYSFYPQSVAGFHNSGAANHMYSLRQNSIDLHPVEEVIDKVVKDAISKPWLPLPLGLKPPSSDSVLAELSRQGISNVPSHINCSNPC